MLKGYVAAGDHSLFIYMEDDLELTWPALQAWAHDESILAPLGYHRGFVRVEFGQTDGRLMTVDQPSPTQVGHDSAATLNVSLWSGREQMHHTGNITAHFVHLTTSYMAMWLASRQQLSEWLLTPQWSVTNGDGYPLMIRETAAWSLYHIKNDEFHKGKRDFKQTLVVPFDPHTSRIANIAKLQHLSNNYCMIEEPPEGAACTIAFDDVLTK